MLFLLSIKTAFQDCGGIHRNYTIMCKYSHPLVLFVYVLAASCCLVGANMLTAAQYDFFL